MKFDEMYEIIINNDTNYDGVFYYGVKTTKIFCKPSCKSKDPLKKNTVFFNNKKEAFDSGYRPCKRCRSDLDTYEPIKVIATKAKAHIEESFKDEYKLNNELSNLGISSHRLREIFKNQYNKTPKEYLDELRFNETINLLEETDENITNVAYAVGFNSISAFYKFFKERSDCSPAEYRKKIKKRNKK